MTVRKKDNLRKKPELHADVKAKVDSQKWFYTDEVKEHFFKPKNFMDEKTSKT